MPVPEDGEVVLNGALTVPKELATEKLPTVVLAGVPELLAPVPAVKFQPTTVWAWAAKPAVITASVSRAFRNNEVRSIFMCEEWGV